MSKNMSKKRLVIHTKDNERMTLTKSYENEVLKLIIKQMKVKTETKRTN
tara:strand:- start:340 stop:486 length:147 start_codon:yes stop_codon:yes gene_type:complete